MRLPMLASASTGASGRHPVDVRALIDSGSWVADTKMDGCRAWVMPDGKILNRKGADMTRKFPEITNPTGEWLDGEIVPKDSLDFEKVLLRESLEKPALIKLEAERTPCVFVAFDLPEYADLPWTDRRRRLDTLDVTATPVGFDSSFIDQVRAVGMEGVVAKLKWSRYQFGKRSADWVKHKFVQRTSCIAYGYTPGHGSRAHFGALLLALIEGDQITPVGRTGSGFTLKQTNDLKQRLDDGQTLVVEVEHMGVTSGRQLRFPTFRGIRSDVDMTDCVIAQLD